MKNTMTTYEEAGALLADKARGRIKDYLGCHVTFSEKPDRSLVTDADLAVEMELRRTINELFPDHGIIGEELPNDRPQADYQWIIDPIDGTEEFIHGIPLFGTIIALEYQRNPILGVIDIPRLDLRLAAAQGNGATYNGDTFILNHPPTSSTADNVRLGISKRKNFLRSGDEGALFDRITATYPNIRVYDSCYAYVATLTGALDVMVDYNVRTWDLTACKVIAEEVGGSFQWIKHPYTEKTGLCGAVFGTKELVSQIVETFL